MRAWYPCQGKIFREKMKKYKDLNESMVSPQGEIILEIKNNKTEI